MNFDLILCKYEFYENITIQNVYKLIKKIN